MRTMTRRFLLLSPAILAACTTATDDDAAKQLRGKGWKVEPPDASKGSAGATASGSSNASTRTDSRDQQPQAAKTKHHGFFRIDQKGGRVNMTLAQFIERLFEEKERPKYFWATPENYIKALQDNGFDCGNNRQSLAAFLKQGVVHTASETAAILATHQVAWLGLDLKSIGYYTRPAPYNGEQILFLPKGGKNEPALSLGCGNPLKQVAQSVKRQTSKINCGKSNDEPCA